MIIFVTPTRNVVNNRINRQGNVDRYRIEVNLKNNSETEKLYQHLLSKWYKP